MKFAKGDKVRVLTDIEFLDGTVIAGTTGIVKDVVDGSFIVEFDGDSTHYGRWVERDELELIEEATE